MFELVCLISRIHRIKPVWQGVYLGLEGRFAWVPFGVLARAKQASPLRKTWSCRDEACLALRSEGEFNQISERAP
jgi:hypothetical protein